MAELGVEAAVELTKALVGFSADMPVVKRTASAQAGSRKYKYADLETIIAAAQPHLAKHKLAVTQPIDVQEDGLTYMLTKVRHESGAMEVTKVRLPIEGVKPQDAGSMITYYRRYAYNSTLGIVVEGEDDDGSTASTNASPSNAEKSTNYSVRVPSQKQLDYLNTLLVEAGYGDQAIRDRLAKVKTTVEASELIEKLKEGA